MAGPSVEGRIGLDTSGVTKGVARAKSKLGELKKSAGGLGSALAAAFSVAAINQFLQRMDRVGKLANRLNTSAESIQRMGHAAELSGSDTEGLVNALTRVTRKATDLKNSGLTRAFNELGIEQKAFINAGMEEKLALLADAFTGAESEGDAFRNLFTLLEDDAKNLIPLLRQGGQGIREMMEGVSTISNEDVKKIEKFNDTITKIQNALMGLVAGPVSGFINFLERGGIAMASFAEAGAQVVGSLLKIGKAAITLDFKGAIKEFKDGAEQITRIIHTAEDLLGKKEFEGDGHLNDKGKKLIAQNLKRKPGEPVAGSGGDRLVGSNIAKGEDMLGSTGFSKGKKLAEEHADWLKEQRNVAKEKAAKDKLDSKAERIGTLNEFSRAITSKIGERDSLQAQLATAGETTTIAGSLARLGGGGNIAQRANPEFQKLKELLKNAEEQLTQLKGIRDDYQERGGVG